jgi:hypothetical protein
MSQETKFSEVWTCPLCSMKLTVYVPVLSPPVCSNHKSGKRIPMNRIDLEK